MPISSDDCAGFMKLAQEMADKVTAVNEHIRKLHWNNIGIMFVLTSFDVPGKDEPCQQLEVFCRFTIEPINDNAH